MKNVPNIGGIHLLSGHLHGCEGKGRGRDPLASWGDSSAGGWHVTAVTVLNGGRGAGDLLRPLIQLRHTAPCQTQQLDSSHSEDSIDLLSGGPVALPYNPAPLNTAITPLLSALPETTPVQLGYGIQVRRESGGQWGFVLNAPIACEGECVTSWEWCTVGDAPFQVWAILTVLH